MNQIFFHETFFTRKFSPCTHLRVLREAKTSTENELNQLRLRNDALTSQLSMAQQALLNTANDKNNVISELRAELKMKSFELTTLGVSFEVLNYFLMKL